MLLPVPRSRYAGKIRMSAAAASFRGIGRYPFAPMPARQQYRLRARSDREVLLGPERGKRYVERETGEERKVVGAVLPLAPSPSNLPYSVDNLRLCGCSLEQLVQKDLNDCPHCGRRLPAVER